VSTAADSRVPPEIAFGKRLRDLRTARDWSQSRLGKQVYVSGDLIGKIEKALRRPTPDLVARLDDVLDTNGELGRAREAFPNRADE
jgi:transcriptional regulator with XRE-family HTH domain